MAELPLCDIAKCQLCEVAKAVQPVPEGTEAGLYSTQLCDTARSALDYTVAGSRPALNTTMAGFKLPQAIGTNSEAGHLIDVVRLQAVTRGQARMAARNEDPLSTEAAPDSSLLDLISKSQGTDPLCIRLKKELQRQPGSGRDISRLSASYAGTTMKGYSLDQQGLLYYKSRVVIP